MLRPHALHRLRQRRRIEDRHRDRIEPRGGVRHVEAVLRLRVVAADGEGVRHRPEHLRVVRRQLVQLLKHREGLLRSRADLVRRRGVRGGGVRRPLAVHLLVALVRKRRHVRVEHGLADAVELFLGHRGRDGVQHGRERAGRRVPDAEQRLVERTPRLVQLEAAVRQLVSNGGRDVDGRTVLVGVVGGLGLLALALGLLGRRVAVVVMVPVVVPGVVGRLCLVVGVARVRVFLLGRRRHPAGLLVPSLD
mmetsp:Transcript_18926/g.58756  ORF Transcript_18926/g.58756 Transcript_18926/m.58756 type:complete len:249 (-) Transcript_18926:1750-2496(-)